MKKIIIAMAMLLAVVLSGCGNDTTTSAPKEDKYTEIPQDAIKTTIDDMKTRDHIKDATFEVNGNHIDMKLVVNDANLVDKEGARSYADSYLRVISNYVDGSNPTKDSYGKVYDGYYVDIIVEDTQGSQLIEGSMMPGYSISWE